MRPQRGAIFGVTAGDSPLPDSGLRSAADAPPTLDFGENREPRSLDQRGSHVYSPTIRTGLFPSLQLSVQAWL